MPQTNEKLVEKLLEEGRIKTEEVKNSFLRTDRSKFVPEDKQKYSYIDRPIPIAEGQTISAPHMVAMMTEELDLEKDSKIMEIGTGSGYQAAILAEIATKGEIHTIETVETLYTQSKEKLKDYNNVEVYKGDGSRGIPEAAPFNRIISTCGSPGIPEPWKEQLEEKGIIVAPVGGQRHQTLKKYKKINGEVKEQKVSIPCAFVPMKGEHGF